MESMENFFKACRTPVCESVLENFHRHETKISKIVINENRVEAYILPKNIPSWPSFQATKQENACCSEIYFKRFADSNLPRFNKNVELLRKRDKVISTGFAGIGKSMEVNGLLMEFLSHIGEEGWPKEVWYRYDLRMIQFYLKSGTRAPCVRTVRAASLGEVLELTDPPLV
jgi:hypothetical protein